MLESGRFDVCFLTSYSHSFSHFKNHPITTKEFFWIPFYGGMIRDTI